MGRSTPPGVAHGAGCPHCIASTSSACGFASTETAKDAAAVASGACRAVCAAELAPNEGEIRRTSTAGNWGWINGAGDVACWIWRIGEMNDSVFTNLQIINDHKDEEKIRCLPLYIYILRTSNNLQHDVELCPSACSINIRIYNYTCTYMYIQMDPAQRKPTFLNVKNDKNTKRRFDLVLAFCTSSLFQTWCANPDNKHKFKKREQMLLLPRADFEESTQCWEGS